MCSKHYFTLLYIPASSPSPSLLSFLMPHCTVLYCTSPTLVGLSCCRELKGRFSVALLSLLETTNRRKALQRKLYNWRRNKIKKYPRWRLRTAGDLLIAAHTDGSNGRMGCCCCCLPHPAAHFFFFFYVLRVRHGHIRSDGHVLLCCFVLVYSISVHCYTPSLDEGQLEIKTNALRERRRRRKLIIVMSISLAVRSSVNSHYAHTVRDC